MWGQVSGEPTLIAEPHPPSESALRREEAGAEKELSVGVSLQTEVCVHVSVQTCMQMHQRAC